MAGKPQPHMDMLVYLSRAFNKEQLESMKGFAKSKEFGGFLAGELEKLTTMAKLLEKMEHKGVFKVKSHPTNSVDYRKLREIIKKCECDGALEEIRKTEDKLKSLGYRVEKDQADDVHGQSSHVAMETAPPYNANNSRSDRSDAFPSGLDVGDSTGGNAPDEDSYAKGKAYLLFINNFENTGKPRRTGSEKDKDNIEAVFEDDSGGHNLKFKCVYEKDLTKKHLMKVLTKTRDKLAKGNYTSFFLIIGSHGEQFVTKDDNNKEATVEGIVTIDQDHITEEELTKPFLGDELKALNDKPKVFIIQACRAPRPDKADDMEASSSEENPSDDTSPVTLTKPANADVLISYSTSKGTRSWRNEDGSWYISELCKAVKKFAKRKHFLDILVRVNHGISLRESTEDGSKQMPCQISTLTKDLWLS